MKKNVGLKVTGIVVGIIAVCILLAYFVGAPLLRKLKYNNAIENAKEGNYVQALIELDGIDDYEDTRIKKQEYAFEAAKIFYEDKNPDEAIKYLAIAANGPDEVMAQKAKELGEKILSE